MVITVTKLSIVCDQCILEVTVVHSLQSFETNIEKFRNIQAISQYFSRIGNETIYLKNTDSVVKLQFNNTQLLCELKIIDSTEDKSDKFTFKVWNIPDNTILSEGDYLLFKFYWKSDPTTYTTYHGMIKRLKAKRTGEGLQTTIKGNLVNQEILYSTSVYEKYPKLTYFNDVQNFIENDLNYNFTTLAPGFVDKTPLSRPILTRDKSVGDVLTEICKQLTKSTGQECSWKFINNNTVLLYKKSDLGTKYLNERYNIRSISIDYNSLSDFIDNGTNFTVECVGIPTLTAGITFYIDCTAVPAYVKTQSAYYVISEIEHNITLNAGYHVKIYCDLANSEENTNVK